MRGACDPHTSTNWDYLESQWPIVVGYFVLIMGYFGVKWPVTLGYLAVQLRERFSFGTRWGLKSGAKTQSCQ